jgi:hypothetical protein
VHAVEGSTGLADVRPAEKAPSQCHIINMYVNSEPLLLLLLTAGTFWDEHLSSYLTAEGTSRACSTAMPYIINMYVN